MAPFRLYWNLSLQLVLTTSSNLIPVLTNVALRKSAKQSSLFGTHTADLAVDGSKERRPRKGLCAETKLEVAHWWRVDLGNLFVVHTVTTTYSDFIIPPGDDGDDDDDDDGCGGDGDGSVGGDDDTNNDDET